MVSLHHHPFGLGVTFDVEVRGFRGLEVVILRRLLEVVVVVKLVVVLVVPASPIQEEVVAVLQAYQVFLIPLFILVADNIFKD